VATTFILKMLPKQANSRSSFLPPLRFFLELFLCTLLALILAGLETEKPTKHIAVLVDNSFHTLSRGNSVPNFDLIREQARSNITTLSPETRVSLFASAPGPTHIAENLSPAQALEQLSTITPVAASGSLQVAAEYISQQATFESLYIYSDAAPTKNYQPVRSLYYFPIDDPGARNNIAIRSVRWSRDEHSSSPSLRVSLVSFSDTDETVRMTARCLQGTTLAAQVSASATVSLLAGNTFDAELTAIPSTTPACMVELTGMDPTFADAIREDNTMWVVAQSTNQSVLLVSPFTPDQLHLTSIDNYSFTHQLPEVFLTNAASPQSRRAVILHRTSTPTLLQENTLYITPERGLPFLTSQRELDTQITTWDRGHPLVRYANLSAITLPEALSFQPTLDLAPIVSVSRGALLLAGEQQLYRSVVAGFEMLPFTGKESPTLSILFLNSLKWVTEASAATDSIRPFETLQSSDAIRYEYLYPEAKRLTDNTPITRPDQTGLLSDGQSIPQLRAVQYFDSQESDVRTAQLFTRPNFVPTEAEQKQGDTGWWLLLAALTILGVDFLFALVAPTRRTA
jgi:hypothetical protein